MAPGEHSLSHTASRHDHRHARVTTREKTDAVLRLLQGESVEALSEEIGVSTSRIERWKDSFVAAGSAELAKRTDVPSNSWVAKHAGSIWQWMWLLLALVVVIGILVVFMQRGGQE